MDEGTFEIRKYIDTEREELGRNLDEMEFRIKEMTDPRVYFDKYTGWILGGAFVGGVLLAVAVGKASANAPKKQEWGRDQSARANSPRFGARQLQRVAATVDTIFDGLVDVVADELLAFVADTVPGFQKQYDERQRARSA